MSNDKIEEESGVYGICLPGAVWLVTAAVSSGRDDVTASASGYSLW